MSCADIQGYTNRGAVSGRRTPDLMRALSDISSLTCMPSQRGAFAAQDGAQCDAEGALPARGAVSGGLHHQPALHDRDRVPARGVPHRPLQARAPGPGLPPEPKEGDRDGAGLLTGHDLPARQEVSTPALQCLCLLHHVRELAGIAPCSRC